MPNRNKDEIIFFLNELFEGDFPHFDIDSIFQVNKKTLCGSIFNDSFKGTKFHYDFKDKKLLHFTSLNSLKSILETESLHFSNFNKFKDKKEMLLAAKEIFINSDLVAKKAKNSLFALSLTELNEPNVKNHYDYHWENYGNNFRGVALELEIKPHKSGYNPLTVQYIKNIEKEKIIQKMKTIYPKYFDDNTFNHVLVCFLYPLLCSFKVQEFDIEKEVRIFYHDEDLKNNIPPSPNKEIERTQFTINCNNEPDYYRNVPLNFPSKTTGTNYISLNKIYLGRNVIPEDDEHNKNEIDELVNRYMHKMCSDKGIEFCK